MPTKIKPNERIELRLLDDGSIDEIVLLDEHGECLFHLETMDESFAWAAIYSTQASPMAATVVLSFRALGNRLKITHREEPTE